MPIHQWTHTDAGLFHYFHQAWTISICDSLNCGLLPHPYFALVERHVVTASPPQTRHTMTAVEELFAERANRITIRHPLGEVVCVIEIVSPGNKSGRAALRSFIEKTAEFLRRGIHVLVIDLFPPSTRDPEGIHKEIWDEIEEQAFELPADKPLTLDAYVAGIPKVAYVEPVAVGDILPDMPAYLEPDSYVPVPLESTYLTTWSSCPAALREAVERAATSP